MKRFLKAFKHTLTIMILAQILFFFIGAFFITEAIKKAPNLNLKDLYPNDSTMIYDDNNHLIAEIGNKKQEWISYNEISKNMIDAIVSIEDERFYLHNGIDIKRLFGALKNDILSLSLKEGASTITQQVIKNVYLSKEKTFDRKIQEIYLALNLEQKLSKNQILEAYLNNILFGKRIYGIKRASIHFFNVLPSELTISMAATLAGLVQLPNYYDPFKNPEKAQERRNIVLKQMLKNGYISDYTYQKTINHSILEDLNKGDYQSEYQYYSTFIDYTIDEALESYGIDAYNGGVKIYTTLSLNIQDEINKIMDNSLETFPDENIKAGIIYLNNQNGEILGIGGSRSIDAYGLDYATKVKHQPGSTIKPILDYAPAFEFLNYGTGTAIKDFEMNYQDGTKIKNWDGLYKGNITIRDALKESRNIPSVYLFNEVGHEKAFSFAMNLGIKKEKNIYESNAIGGFDEGYTVLEIANAYQAFANEGKFIKAHSIKKIVTKDETINANIPSYIAMKKTTAFMINDILRDVSLYSGYDVNGMHMMAKTGQTNYDIDTINKYNIPINATKDSWFVGYTNLYTCAIWTGYDVIKENNYLDYSKKDIPRYLVKTLLKKYGNYGPNPYQMPIGLVNVAIEKGHENTYLAGRNTSYYLKRYEYFIVGSEPKTEYLDENEFT